MNSLFLHTFTFNANRPCTVILIYLVVQVIFTIDPNFYEEVEVRFSLINQEVHYFWIRFPSLTGQSLFFLMQLFSI